MRCIFGLITLFAITLARSFAADATFSKNGQHVYAIEFGTPHLFDIDIAKQSVSRIDIASQIEDSPIGAINTSKSGDLIAATANAAWSCNIDKKTCTKLCSAPEEVQFKGMAFDPKSGGILFSARNERDLYEGGKLDPTQAVFFFDPRENKLHPVLLRRIEYLMGIAFSTDGQLFFGTRGDLWQGFVTDYPQEAKAEVRVLDGIRCCPIANLETSDSTTFQVGVVKSVVAGDKVYALLNRWGGGLTEGQIVRLSRPPRLDNKRFEHLQEQGENEISERLKLYSAEASSVEVLVDGVGAWHLGASLDGKYVFFGSVTPEGNGKVYLVENNGKPRELKVRFPE